MSKQYLVTMYEYDWVELDDNGHRYYLDRVYVKTDKKVDDNELEKLVLEKFNDYRREEDLVEYSKEEVYFDIVDLDELNVVNYEGKQTNE